MARLDQLLARNLGCSRKEAARLIRGGAVRDSEGRVISNLRADVGTSTIVVHGQPLQLRQRMHLMQHKPAGVVTSRKDGVHATAWGLVRDAPLHAELLAIGRLDLDATGLLLWTTEGPAVHALTHPKRGISREYQVALPRPFGRPPLDANGRIDLRLADGYQPTIVSIEVMPESGRHPALALPEGTEHLAKIVLRSGAFHEVKRIFLALDSEVLALTRTAHAGLRLPEDLGVGEWRELDELPGGTDG